MLVYRTPEKRSCVANAILHFFGKMALEIVDTRLRFSTGILAVIVTVPTSIELA